MCGECVKKEEAAASGNPNQMHAPEAAASGNPNQMRCGMTHELAKQISSTTTMRRAKIT